MQLLAPSVARGIGGCYRPNMRHVVIMAGGSGTRFWPASRAAHPKQFLKIGSDRSLLEQTADRVIGMVGPERLWVVTGGVHADHARHSLPQLPPDNILVEPTGRNTAACIGWATHTILEKDPEARIAVLPADHFLRDVPSFLEHLDAAFEAAQSDIVLFGIVPDRPETGYGYIQSGDARGSAKGKGVSAVKRFVEKPDRATAEKYLVAGDYLWNSGMFVFPAGLMRDEIATHLPELHAGLLDLQKRKSAVAEIYPKLPSISIDVGVMEKSKRTAVIAGTFAWSDVGSWDAAMEVYPADSSGNVLLGDALPIDVKQSYVDARSGRLVAVVGLEEVIVVDTPDAVLVMKRGKSQDVKAVVDLLKGQNKKSLL
jgi:mannose-1-phosphate guanylyltransferase